MKMKNRIAAAILSVAMLATMSSCSGDTTWVAEYNGNKLPSGVYLCYLMSEYASAGSQVEDSSKDVLDQKVGDQDARTWITDQAAQDLREYVAVEKEFERLGLSMDDSDTAKIENLIESQWSVYESMYTSNGVSKESYSLVMKNSYKNSMIFDKYYAEGGLEEVPQEELKDLYEDSYVKARYMLFRKKDDSGNALSDELLEDYRSRTEEMAEKVADGEDLNELIIENEKKLMEENDGTEEDIGHDHDTDDAHDILFNVESNSLPEDFVSNVKGMQVGDCKTFEDDDYIYVAQRMDINEDAEDFESVSSDILTNYKKDEFSEKVQALAGEVQLSFNEAALSRYTPDKIK